MSRCVSRQNQRLARARNRLRWLADCQVYWQREGSRGQLTGPMRELSEKVRAGHYPGRDEDLAALERLWRLVRGLP